MEIDKHVPMPKLRQEYRYYPFNRMDVGDSFFVPDEDGVMTRRIQTQISKERGHGETRRYTTRRETGGIRVWRIG